MSAVVKHTPGPWEQWIGPSLGSPWKYGRTISVNVPELGQMAIASTDFHTEELGYANAAHIVKCVNAHDDLIAALKTWLEEYIALVNSGDAGFWDPEKELKVIKTRELLLQVQS